MDVPIAHVLVFALALFALGAVGAMTRRHVLVVLLCLQLMGAAAVVVLVAFARLHGDAAGHVFAVLATLVAGAQAVVGCAVAVAFFRGRESLDVEEASELKW